MNFSDIGPYRELLDTINQGVVLMDAKEALLFSNRAHTLALGEPMHIFNGQNTMELFKAKKTDICISQKVIETQHEVRMRQLYLNSSGDVFESLMLHKPYFRNGKIEYILATVEEVIRIHKEPEVPFAESKKCHKAVFRSKAMTHIFNDLELISSLPVNLLLLGETGVGKDVLAEYTHYTSNRRDGPFIKINCAAIPENLMESEFFGYAKGSFTGAATEGKRGLIAEAHGGTLFLDEINSLPLNLQGKLLYTIENKTIRRLGSTREEEVDFRLISASNEDLEQLVEQKKFRRDLFFRLSVFSTTIPPLRERPDDIELLSNYFMEKYRDQYGRSLQLTSEFKKALTNYNWPGNVRELKNFIERMVILDRRPTEQIKFSLPKSQTESIIHFTPPPLWQGNSLHEAMEQVEKKLIHEALAQSNSMGAAAEALDINPSTLSRKITKYKLR